MIAEDPKATFAELTAELREKLAERKHQCEPDTPEEGLLLVARLCLELVERVERLERRPLHWSDVLK